jgi:hypothetical protein
MGQAGMSNVVELNRHRQSRFGNYIAMIGFNMYGEAPDLAHGKYVKLRILGCIGPLDVVDELKKYRSDISIEYQIHTYGGKLVWPASGLESRGFLYPLFKEMPVIEILPNTEFLIWYLILSMPSGVAMALSSQWKGLMPLENPKGA